MRAKNFRKKQYDLFMAGNSEEVWARALKQEARRKSKKGGGKKKTPKKVEEARFDRAAQLVRLGETGKGARHLVSHGTAPCTDEVLSQLQSKHPKRPEPVQDPSIDVMVEETKG